jgi:hypothetical protein
MIFFSVSMASVPLTERHSSSNIEAMTIQIEFIGQSPYLTSFSIISMIDESAITGNVPMLRFRQMH